jgi:hypothetical protein
MFNDERNSTSDTSSTNSSYHASIDPMRPRAEHPSSHRLPRLAAALGGQDLWASMLASIRQLSSPPNPMRNTPDLSRRPRSGGMPSRSSKRAGGKVRTYTVTIVEELSNSRFSRRWRDPTLCNYQERVWSPCVARVPGRCALSGKRISRDSGLSSPRRRTSEDTQRRRHDSGQRTGQGLRSRLIRTAVDVCRFEIFSEALPGCWSLQRCAPTYDRRGSA